MNFDFENVQTTEFGIGRDDGDAHAFHCVDVNGDVQTALLEMAQATWEAMQRENPTPPRYDPSEKHASKEHVALPLNDELAVRMHALHTAQNLDNDQAALNHMEDVFCYFARFTDNQGRHLTALRRATQFKGILRSRGRLMRMVDDSLQIVEDQIFKLDSDFDLLIDDENIHILRPSGFEFAGKLQEAILAAVEDNIEALEDELAFVDFASIQEYASSHPRAARYLASIRSQQEVARIDMAHLTEACGATGVQINVEDETISVDEQHIMGFLEVLDRRRYEVRLVPEEPEQYRAPSRQRIGQ